MPKILKLNREQERIRVWTLREEGLSWSQIATRTGKNRKSCRRICKRVKETGSFKDKPHTGRPSKLTDRDRRHIVGILRNNKEKNAEAIRKEAAATFNVKLCRNSIAKVLKESGYVCRVKKKKPLLTKRHKQQRLAWALNHRTWTVDEWRKVIWSDETAFMLVNGAGREYCWTKDGDVLDNDQVQPTKKFGGGKLMIWGCITYEGVGFSCKVEGNMDAELYSDILRDELERTIAYYHLDHEEVIFQQDGDSKHTSNLAQETLDELGLEVMEWPAQSPDLNPIEHVWKQLKSDLKAENRVFATKDELWEAVEELMMDENKDTCRNLIASMPSRVQAVINAKGGYTKY
jgi:transposase